MIFTSIEDDRYGGGGTFDTTGDGFDTTAGNNAPRPGDWGGLYFAPASLGSIDHAVIAYGGGTTSIEGGFASFNAVEIYQATVRLADSTLEYNADGTGADTASDGERNGREDNGSATIFVRGAQPVIVNNLFENNDINRSGTLSGAPVISIDVDSLNSTFVPDWGRSTGPLQRLQPVRRQLRPAGAGQRARRQRHQRHVGPRRRAHDAVRLGRHRHRSRRGERNQSCPISTPTAACGWRAATRPAWW